MELAELGWNHLQTKLPNKLPFYSVKQSMHLLAESFVLLSKMEVHLWALFIDDSTPSDNGPTAKKFFGYKYRKHVLDLFPTATPQG